LVKRSFNMHAIQLTQNGGPEVLTYTEIATPRPAAGQVLIRHTAIGVNYIDTYYRTGQYKASLPLVVGNEAAGVVEQLGAGVTEVTVGQRVGYYSTQLGAYADYAAVPADKLIMLPDHITDHQGAAVLLQGMTAHYLAYTVYPIRPGDTVLIHAGAGGVGLLLSQIARRRGARVITTVSTPDKAELSRANGADEVILYTQTDFVQAVKDLTGGQGVHAVYDGVGKTTFEGSLNSLRPLGTMASFGSASGVVPPVPLSNLTSRGSLVLSRPSLGHFIATRSALLERAGAIFNWVASGELNVLIQPPYKLANAAQAHRDLEGRGTTGKLILEP
jgi:NADPH:quinone reductase